MKRPESWPEYWKGGSWSVGLQTITETELLNAYLALKNSGVDAFLTALGVPRRSERKADRAFALLKREGFVAFDKKTRTWEVLK